MRSRTTALVTLVAVASVAVSTMLASTATAGEPEHARMVAIGDSYTSGEGVPPFDVPTDVTEVNECHRSPLAYPVPVAGSLGLKLDSWACSGATTGDLASAAVSASDAPWDDPVHDVGGAAHRSALDRLGIDSAVVAITIGGNDIGFPEIIVDCLMDSLPCTRHDAAVQQDLVTLQSSLDGLFADITMRLSTASTVLIVGYPRVFPVHPHADCDFVPLLPVGTFTQSEQNWANAKTAQLNETIREAADRAEGPRFLFVDVWDSFGHSELCRPDATTGSPVPTSPLINAVDLINFEHSFHPSAPGHQVLADRVLSVLDVDPISGDAVGLVEPSTGFWHLSRYPTNSQSFYFGNPGDVPFVGDWNCDGTETPGLYRQSDGFAYLRNANTQGIADIRFFFGNPGDIPLAGDFNGDGCDTVSVYRPSQQRFYMINELGEHDGGIGPADNWFLFGNPGDKPVVGDWDGDGVDEVGLHREATGLFYWRNTLTAGAADGEIFFGNPGDRFVAGDWGVVDDRETPAVFRPGNATIYFRHTLSQGVADSQIVWLGAGPDWLPIAGRIGAS
jgi:lysophospholipase L1-like esterase